MKELKKKMVLQAVKTVKELHSKHLESAKKRSLLEDDNESKLLLQIMLKKIPKTETINMIKIHVPHSFLKDTAEVCLITGDLNKRNRKAEIESDILHYKELLQKRGVKNITEVMTLRQLRTEYKPYEAKRKLVGAFDIFLADSRIMHILPRVLGKFFFKKKKYPIQVELRSTNLNDHVNKILSSCRLNITGDGNCCTCEIARLDMPDSEILENVMAVSKVIAEKLPGGFDNILGMHIKTPLSGSLPIYMSFDNPNNVELDDEEKKEKCFVADLDTFPNTKVKIYPDGRVERIRTRDDFKARSIKSESISEPSNNTISNNEVICEKESTNFIKKEGRNTKRKSGINQLKAEDLNAASNSNCESGNEIEEKKKRNRLPSVQNDNEGTSGKSSMNLVKKDGRNKRKSGIKNQVKLEDTNPNAALDPDYESGNEATEMKKKNRLSSVQNDNDSCSENQAEKKKLKKRVTGLTSESMPVNTDSSSMLKLNSKNSNKKRKLKETKSSVVLSPNEIDSCCENQAEMKKRKKRETGLTSESMPINTDSSSMFKLNSKNSNKKRKLREAKSSVILSLNELDSDSENEAKDEELRKELAQLMSEDLDFSSTFDVKSSKRKSRSKLSDKADKNITEDPKNMVEDEDLAELTSEFMSENPNFSSISELNSKSSNKKQKSKKRSSFIPNSNRLSDNKINRTPKQEKGKNVNMFNPHSAKSNAMDKKVHFKGSDVSRTPKQHKNINIYTPLSVKPKLMNKKKRGKSGDKANITM